MAQSASVIGICPDHSKPDHSQPDHSQPDHSQPDHSRPDHSKPGDVLTMENIVMRFGAVEVLRSVSLSVRRGEILGLLGANGSGKSTLIKVLAGFNSPEPGARIRMWGEVMTPPLSAHRIRRAGVAFVHQHLGLIPSLTVAENMIVADDDRRRPLFVNWRAEHRRLTALFAEFGLTIDPRATVEALSPVERAFVAIVRALDDLRRSTAGQGGEGVLVLDEPTPFLSAEDVAKLFDLLRGIRARGASVIIVTHDIDEVLEITDRVAIMRDGRLAAVKTTAQTGRQAILDTIVGHTVKTYARKPRAAPKGVQIQISGAAGGQLLGLDLDLAAGEIVGLTGLIGSGFADVPYLLFGASPGAGRLCVGDQATDLARMTPAAARAFGLALLPGDRIHQGGIGSLSVADNATMLALPRLRGALGLNIQALLQEADGLIQTHDVRPPRARADLGTLSGGNQQKVILGKWLAEAPALFLLDEPTQGVDFGARQQILAALDAASAQGTTILCASTDYEQLAQICDRVVVFARGKPAATLTGARLTKDAIARACFGEDIPEPLTEAAQ